MITLKLNLGLIIDSLPADSYEYVFGDVEGAMNLRGVFPFVPGQSAAEDTLYVSAFDTIASASAECPRFVACIGGGTAARAYFEENQASGIICPNGADMLIVLSQIAEVFHKYDRLEYELFNAMLADSPTRSILNCCANFFEGHVMLFNSHNSGALLLDHSDNYIPAESNLLWQDILSHNRLISDRNPREKAKMLPSNPGKYPKATFHEAVNNYSPHFVTAFDYGNLRFATLIIMGAKRALSSRQHWLVDYIADIIHPVITRRYNSSLNVRNHARVALSNALHLARQSGQNTFNTMKNNLAQLRWDMEDDYRIVLVSLPPECHNVSHYLYNYEHVFINSYFDCIALHFEDLIFILLHGDACSITTQQLEIFEKQLELDNGVCSIGAVFCDFAQVVSHLNLTVLPFQSSVDERRIRYYSEMMSAHIIRELESVFPLRAVCNSEVVRLQRYDQENRTNYLTTLETYLMCNNSLSKTANKLFIHKNTMSYRLNCIKEIVKLDLNDPEERLNILLSCIVLRTLGS